LSGQPLLVDRLGRPMASPAAGQVGMIARTAGGHRGTMSGWLPQRHSAYSAPYERELVARRSEDLAANDAHAAALFESLSTNVTGTGLVPQSRIDAEALGIPEDTATDLRNQIEAAFAAWAQKADSGGRMTFNQLQFLIFRTVLVQGEYLNLCVSKTRPDGSLPPGRRFAMALQSIHPARLRTPAAMALDASVRDGVALGDDGEALGYWIAQPDSLGRIDYAALTSSRYYPASVAHRPVVLHGFPQTQAEQYRGIPSLAPAMKFFRDLGDCLDAELVGQIVTAQVPMAITADINPLVQTGVIQGRGDIRSRPDGEYVTEVPAGTVLQLYEGEDIKPLDSPRPGSNFDSFVTRILRAAGAAVGLPYEMVVKDFSKTNYSSARAALLEAWRVIRRHQDWLESGYCIPIWEAVIEEAVARGYVVIPEGAPDFWLPDGSPDPRYLASDWIPPRQGHVDPTKDTGADIEAIESGIATFADVIASRGGDYESSFRQQKRERDLRKKLGLPDLTASTPKPAPKPTQPDANPDASDRNPPEGGKKDDTGQEPQEEAA